MKAALSLKPFVLMVIHLLEPLALIAITGKVKSAPTLLVPYKKKALFALDYFEKNINGDIFYNWCKDTLIPSLKTKCVIVMDNASFHKRVQRLLNRHGHRLLFLPPYSPDLNPIEKKWAQAKFLRQGWMENNLPKLFHDMGCTNFILD